MNTPAWTIAALVAGVAIMFLGPLIVDRTATTIVWTDEQAEARSKAAADLHSASYGGHSHDPVHKHTHKTPAPDDPELVAIRAAYDEQEAKFVAAASRQGWYKIGLRALGVIVAGVGVGGYVRARYFAEQED